MRCANRPVFLHNVAHQASVALRVPAFACAMLLGACGGGGGGGGGGATDTGPGPPLPPLNTLIHLSGQSPFAPNCAGPATGTLYFNAEVEPFVAVNPRDSANLVAVWQQDRWSNGSSQGLVTGISLDGGFTWTNHVVPFSRCAGGNLANGGNYARATDPWITFSPHGVAFQIALSTSGDSFTPGSSSAVLVSRSTDKGATWSDPLTLIRDSSDFFNDKETISADPNDARFVYAVWDRLSIVTSSLGPAYFARSVDGGLSWEAARPIYDPGARSQTIGNQIVTLPNGMLVNLFTQIDIDANGQTSAFLGMIRSADNGATWSQILKIADLNPLGAHDPETGSEVRDGSLIGQIAVSGGGALFVVWQDARAGNGQRDGVLLSRSADGGLTWSAPLRVNGDPSVQAFTPSVTVRSDGTIGVAYYDFRGNTVDSATLPTDYWLARSSDGVMWSESHVSGPFDLAIAPNALGLFLGDYQGLTSSGPNFIPVFVQTSNGDITNRTDVVTKLLNISSNGVAAPADTWKRMLEHDAALPRYRAEAIRPIELTSQLKQRLHENIVRTMQRRIPTWDSRLGLRPPRP
jgi:hypothetical protein